MDLRRPASCKQDDDGSLFMCPRLYTAAFEGHTEEVTGLLLTGCSVDAPAAGMAAHHRGPCTAQEVTAERNTLLHIAAGQGHGGLIAELCYWDSSLLSSVNKALDTPLHSAARAGGADAVEGVVRLARANCVEEGGVIRGKNVAGDTAMHLAARHDQCAAVEKLMELAPELASELNGAGVSPLYLAVTSGSVDAVRAIVSHGDASAAGPNLENALHAAVLESSEMAGLLLQWRPALASELDINKSSPLHFASSDGDCSIIEKIITHSPPSTTYLQDNEGLSALNVAAVMGHVAVVRLLLRFHPACADVRDNHGRTFLHAAAMKGHSWIVSYVIKDRMLEQLLNTQDNQGNTPLHLAVVAGEHKVIYKLLSSGKVCSHIMNNAGCTPSDLIENSTGFYSMARLVLELYVSGARFRPQRQDHIENWNGQDMIKWREATSKNLAIVSTLVATVAFSAAFNVPGSYGPSGKANLSGNRLYDAFMVLDTIAVTSSVIATILLIYGRASRSHRSWLGFMVSMHFLWISLNSMMLGFFAAMVAVMRERNSLKVALTQVIYNGLYILMTLLANLATPRSFVGVMRFLVRSFSERQRRAKKRIGRQFPFVVFYALNVVVFIVINTLALCAVQFTGSM